VLAHAGTPDEQVALITIVTGLWIGWAGLSRIRERGFPRVPRWGGYALLVAGVAVIAAGLTLPRQFMCSGNRCVVASPTPTADRPASTASITIVRPTPAEVVHGDRLEVVMTLPGGTIVDTTSTKLTPDTGHVHLSIDDRLVSMTYGLVQVLDLSGIAPGEHTLQAEFVAADHGPFDPRVLASVTFTKAAS